MKFSATEDGKEGSVGCHNMKFHMSNGRECRGTEEPLDEGEKGECKAGLKLKIQKNKDHGIKSYYFLANRRGKSEAVTGFIFLAPK